MRNVVKVLVLIFIMSVILRDTEGASLMLEQQWTTTPAPLVAGGYNVTDASGAVKSEKIRLYKIRFDKFSRLELALLPYGLDLEDQSPARISTTHVDLGTSVAIVLPEY